MKEEKNHIDKLFQEKLGERSFEVPSAFLADMEAKLDATNTRGGGWITFFTVVFFGALMATSYALITNDELSSLLTGKLSIAKNIAGDNLQATSKEQDKNISVNKNSVSTNNNETIDNVINNSNEQDGSDVEPTTGNESNKSANKPNTNEQNGLSSDFKNGTQKTSQSAQPAVSEFFNQANSAKGKVGAEKTSFAKPQQSKNKTSTKTSQTSENGVIDLLPAKAGQESSNPAQAKNNGVQNLIQTKKNKASEQFANSKDANSYAIDLFEDTTKRAKRNIRDSVVIRDSIVFRDSVVIRDSVVLKYQKDPTRKFKLEAQVYGGFMRVQPKIESPFATYKTALESEETKILSPDFGFQLNAYYKKWTLGTGLKYYQFGEKTNYSTLKVSSMVDSVFTSITFIYLDSAGDTIIPTPNNPAFDTIVNVFIDTSYIYDSVSNNKQWQNSYSRFVIPLNFGYRFDYKNWALIPRVGLNFEFSTTKQRGLYVDALKEEFIELEQRNFGMSYQLSLELRRSFGNWHAFINPYYRNNFGYVINTPDLKRRYGGFGATFGVGLEF